MLSPLLARYDAVLLDLDGCVWVGDAATPRAPEALTALREAGKGIAFVTNNAHHTSEEFVRKLWSLGFRAAVEEVVTAGGALQHLLNTEYSGSSAFVIGAPSVHRHVADAGLRIVNGTTFASRAEVVVVGGHEHFDFDELRTATRALLRGAPLVGTDRDRTFPMPDGATPGTGTILAALEYAAGAEARAVGKPDPQLHLTALDRLRAGGGATKPLAVGDRLDADLAGAHAAGIDGAIVLTGATTTAEAAAARERPATEPRPIAVADSLADLVLGGRPSLS